MGEKLNKRNLDRMIRSAIIELITEEQTSSDAPPKDDKKKPKSSGGSKVGAEGALGRGGWSRIVGGLKNRAESEPRKLLKDLGVSSVSGKDDLSKAASVLEQAISGNELMAKAFSEPVEKKVGEKKQVSITPADKDLTVRNATKYLILTLVAAENAGVLRLKEGVMFMPRSKVSVPTLTSV